MHIPTFDEWYINKYGDTFKNLHQRPQDMIHDSMVLFTEYLAQYHYEILKEMNNAIHS